MVKRGKKSERRSRNQALPRRRGGTEAPSQEQRHSGSWGPSALLGPPHPRASACRPARTHPACSPGSWKPLSLKARGQISGIVGSMWADYQLIPALPRPAVSSGPERATSNILQPYTPVRVHTRAHTHRHKQTHVHRHSQTRAHRHSLLSMAAGGRSHIPTRTALSSAGDGRGRSWAPGQGWGRIVPVGRG